MAIPIVNRVPKHLTLFRIYPETVKHQIRRITNELGGPFRHFQQNPSGETLDALIEHLQASRAIVEEFESTEDKDTLATTQPARYLDFVKRCEEEADPPEPEPTPEPEPEPEEGDEDDEE